MAPAAGFDAYMNTYFVTIGDAREIDPCPELSERVCTYLREKYPAVFCRLQSAWIISASVTADEIRDSLLTSVGEIPTLLVVRAGEEAAWAGFNETDADWLLTAL